MSKVVLVARYVKTMVTMVTAVPEEGKLLVEPREGKQDTAINILFTYI